eukprot:6457621-Amphidinium_carterae.1
MLSRQSRGTKEYSKVRADAAAAPALASTESNCQNALPICCAFLVVESSRSEEVSRVKRGVISQSLYGGGQIGVPPQF